MRKKIHWGALVVAALAGSALAGCERPGMEQQEHEQGDTWGTPSGTTGTGARDTEEGRKPEGSDDMLPQGSPTGVEQRGTQRDEPLYQQGSGVQGVEGTQGIQGSPQGVEGSPNMQRTPGTGSEGTGSEVEGTDTGGGLMNEPGVRTPGIDDQPGSLGTEGTTGSGSGTTGSGSGTSGSGTTGSGSGTSGSGTSGSGAGGASGTSGAGGGGGGF